MEPHAPAGRKTTNKELLGLMLTPKAFTTATKVKTGINHEQRYQSVLMELDLAITFCVLPRSDQDKVNPDRNIENAEKAFSDGVRFLFHANLSCKVRGKVINKLALLHSKIHDFDQQMVSHQAFEFQKAHACARSISEGARQ
jgi:hypothetical protein